VDDYVDGAIRDVRNHRASSLYSVLMRYLVLAAALFTTGCGDVEFPAAPTREVPGFYTQTHVPVTGCKPADCPGGLPGTPIPPAR